MVGENNPDALLGFENDVIVFAVPAAVSRHLVREEAWPESSAWVMHCKAPRHSHVDDQCFAGIEVHKQILRSPPQTLHLSASQPNGKIARQRNAKIGTPGIDAQQSLPRENRQ
jgi:hypothetical protein